VRDRPPRVGKTHLAITLGILTAELGHRLFVLAVMEMARRLGAAFRENRLPHAMKMLTQPRLIIVTKSVISASIRRALQCSSRSSATVTKRGHHYHFQ
jgi:hypothetical protein